MGANHLREWIAIGYDPKHKDDLVTRPQKNEAEEFYIKIFGKADFEIVRQLCNRAKHLTTRCRSTGYSSGVNIDEWDCLVDDDEIGAILHRLLDFYRNEWFENQ